MVIGEWVVIVTCGGGGGEGEGEDDGGGEGAGGGEGLVLGVLGGSDVGFWLGDGVGLVDGGDFESGDDDGGTGLVDDDGAEKKDFVVDGAGRELHLNLDLVVVVLIVVRGALSSMLVIEIVLCPSSSCVEGTPSVPSSNPELTNDQLPLPLVTVVTTTTDDDTLESNKTSPSCLPNGLGTHCNERTTNPSVLHFSAECVTAIVVLIPWIRGDAQVEYGQFGLADDREDKRAWNSDAVFGALGSAGCVGRAVAVVVELDGVVSSLSTVPLSSMGRMDSGHEGLVVRQEVERVDVVGLLCGVRSVVWKLRDRRFARMMVVVRNFMGVWWL